MGTKTKYYEVLGLTDQATRHEVKRAYRKLAMRLHPDRNPDPRAHRRFLELTEAYHILMDDKPSPHVVPGNTPPPRKERTEEDRIREAQERLRQQQRRIRQQQEHYFRSMTSGTRWRIFRLTVYLAAFLGIILLIEPMLPAHFEAHRVEAYSSTYNGLEHTDIRYMQTDRGMSVFVADPHPDIMRDHPGIWVERSFLMRNPVRIWYQQYGFRQSYPVDFSVANLYPLMSVFLFFPAFTLWYKRRTFYFVMCYYFSQYIVGAAAVYILLSQDRWAHILTFGYF